MKNFWEIDEYEFDKTFDVNVKGLFFTCQAMAEYMKEKEIKGQIGRAHV